MTAVFASCTFALALRADAGDAGACDACKLRELIANAGGEFVEGSVAASKVSRCGSRTTVVSLRCASSLSVFARRLRTCWPCTMCATSGRRQAICFKLHCWAASLLSLLAGFMPACRSAN